MKFQTKWRFIDSGPCDAAYNMAIDEAIAISVRDYDAPATLRFYGWDRPSVTLGSFQKISDIVYAYCLENNIPVVRRPTGGRGILHGNELTYSFSARSKGDFSRGLLETYKRLSVPFETVFRNIGLDVVKKTIREEGRNINRSPICFASTSYGEISLNGLKIIGSAQKRWKDAFLQQGSVPFSIEKDLLQNIFKIKDSLSDKLACPEVFFSNVDKKNFKNMLKSAFEEVFDIVLIDSELSHQEESIARELCLRKYQNPQWTLNGARNNLSYDNNEIPMTAL